MVVSLLPPVTCRKGYAISSLIHIIDGMVVLGDVAIEAIIGTTSDIGTLVPLSPYNYTTQITP